MPSAIADLVFRPGPSSHVWEGGHPTFLPRSFPMNHLKSVAARIAFVLSFFMVAFASGASAQPISKFQILLDLDNHQNTGCDVMALTGMFKGVERILTTTVDASLSPPRVTKIEVSVCTGVTF